MVLITEVVRLVQTQVEVILITEAQEATVEGFHQEVAHRADLFREVQAAEVVLVEGKFTNTFH